MKNLIAVMAALLLALPVHAQQSSSPGLFEALGKLIKPAEPAADETAPAATRSNSSDSAVTTRNLKRTGNGDERRIALIIGNGAYRSEDLKPLTNPGNDADDIAAALRGFGFEVLAHKNLDRRRMKDVIAEFGRKSANADTAFFYYAGHGIQIKNQNYLMPVDATIRSEADVMDEGINVNFPLEEMENAKARVNLVMLDACRNNDFSGRFRSGASRGLAAPASLPKGTVIVYATDPGNTASDGTGRNGLFTSGLLAAFKGDDLSLDGVLTTASAVVEQKSGGKQTPYVNGPQLVKKNFYFLFQGPATVNVQPPPPSDPETEAWKAAERANQSAGYKAYLDAYPGGRYAVAAKIILDGMQKPGATTTPERPSSTVAPAPTLGKPAADDPEGALWAEVKQSGAKEYYEVYLKQYPKGRYAPLAKLEVRKIEDKEKAEKAKEESERKQIAEQGKQEQMKAEHDVWESAKRENSVTAYANYLSRYPSGAYAGLAKLSTEKGQREEAEKTRQESALKAQEAKAAAESEKQATQRAEEVAWDKAKVADTAAEYDHYLESYPKGRYSSLAKSAQQKAQRESMVAPVHKGIFLAYATSPGGAAEDGRGRNGLFTEYLLKGLRGSDTNLTRMFRQIRVDVIKQSASGQIPVITDSLTGEVELKSQKFNQGQRFALVIGNGAYRQVPTLDKAVVDASDVTQALQSLGFKVSTLTNASRSQVEKGIVEFVEKTASGGIGFFYFAGHGTQISGENFLLPVDADPSSASAVRESSVKLESLIDQLRDSPKGLSIVVLDASRDNPFATKPSWISKR